MTINYDLSQDYLRFDSLQTVSYQVKTAEGTYPSAATYASAVDVAYVLQREITKQDVLNDPGLLEGDLGRFHMWLTPLGEIRPKIGDRVTDAAGVLWIVQAVDDVDMDSSGLYQRRVVKCRKAIA